MTVVDLVRPGQASFGTADYARLSDLGKKQSQIAGKHFASQGVTPIRIVHGEMLRQRWPSDGILTGLEGPTTDLEDQVEAG